MLMRLTRRSLLLGLALAVAAAFGPFRHVGGPPPSSAGFQLLVGTSPTGSAINAPVADGTVIGEVPVQAWAPLGTSIGTVGLSLSGTDASAFRLSAAAAPANLLVNGAKATCAKNPYVINIVGTLAGSPNSPMTTPVNIYCHAAGDVITTYTLQNTDTSNPVAAGSVYIAGQGFRRGDVPSGFYPAIRDASNHATLTYQWDEIATRSTNGDDGSWRHAVFSVLLPASSPQYTSGSIPACTASPCPGTFQLEFVLTSGTYSASASRTLADLCGVHILKLRLTDVRNQDDTTRDSGAGTYDLCANTSNVGRDAPRKVATGPVRDSWVVPGLVAYDTSGNKDPLLYVQGYVDVTTNLSGTMGPVRHIFRVDNSWMNVSAGSAGNSGAPGPVGLTNDPQALSYRPQVLDGSTNVLDYSWYDAALASSGNPFHSGGTTVTGCGGINLSTNGVMTVPTSTFAQPWYSGMATRYSTSGGVPTGLTNSKLYHIFPLGASYSIPPGTNHFDQVVLTDVPGTCDDGWALPSTQGTGTQNFSYRIWHTHWMGWYSTDPSGLENWTNGSLVSSHSPLLPQFTHAQLDYWNQTGTWPPINYTQTTNDPVNYSNAGITFGYGPLGHNNSVGGAGVGLRTDLGLVSGFAADAIIVEDAQSWQNLRDFALTGAGYPWGSLLNEATGRLPVMNNGPPNATTHAGDNHATYSGLGANWAGTVTHWSGGNYARFTGLALMKENSPLSDYGSYHYGPWYVGTVYGEDHEPSFYNGAYQFFGSRHYLDALYMHASRAIGVANGYTYIGLPNRTWYNSVQVNPPGTIYYGIFWCQWACERRDGFWTYREQMLCAAFGADGAPERQYCNDMLNENYYFSLAMQSEIDPSGNYANTLASPMAGMQTISDTGFMDSYGLTTTVMSYALQRDPMAQYWLPWWARAEATMCLDIVPNSLSSFYCAATGGAAVIHDMSGFPTFPSAVGGSTFNGSDATDQASGMLDEEVTFNGSAGTVHIPSGAYDWSSYPYFANGDTVKFIGCTGNFACGVGPPFELGQHRWYTVTGFNNTTGNFQIVCPLGTTAGGNCPTPGAAYIAFTTDGSTPYNGTPEILWRPAYTQPTDWCVNCGVAGSAPTYGQQMLRYLCDVMMQIGCAARDNMAARALYAPDPAVGTNYGFVVTTVQIP